MAEYRRLEHGELIKHGDEVDVSNGWNDEPLWVPTELGGRNQRAPDPQYPAHRQYRRKVEHDI